MDEKMNNESNLLATKVFESIEEGIMVTNFKQEIVFVNPAFTALTGYSLDDVVGESPKLLSSGLHKQEFYFSMWAAIRETGSWQGEIWNKKKDGEFYLEELSITQVKDTDGEVTHYVGIFKDITLRKELEAKIRYQAHHDILTGLPNRILFQDRLFQAIRAAERDPRQIGIMFVDLDRFKRINDNLGHHIGDKLLKQASDRMKQSLRASDTIARIGGDELVVLLPEVASREDCAAIAKKISALIEKPFYIEGHELFVTCSIGISLYPDDSTDQGTLVRLADQALYKAKNAGRNNFQFYVNAKSPESNAFSLETSLRDALKYREFNILYQPIFNIADQTIMGAESLIRWNNRDKGLIYPSEFIPVAEETGLILTIDRWVLRQACLQMIEWHELGYPHLKVSVNLSMLQFQQPDLVDTISTVLRETGLPPSSLILEITERTMMNDPESSIMVMQKIRDLGVSISLDDFGIGYSAFNYLKQLPINKLKIDISFIKDIADNDKDFLIVKALISMAHSLKLAVVAEGVEKSEQLSLLTKEQCDYVQGFFFNKPLSAKQFEKAYLEQHA